MWILFQKWVKTNISQNLIEKRTVTFKPTENVKPDLHFDSELIKFDRQKKILSWNR